MYTSLLPEAKTPPGTDAPPVRGKPRSPRGDPRLPPDTLTDQKSINAHGSGLAINSDLGCRIRLRPSSSRTMNPGNLPMKHYQVDITTRKVSGSLTDSTWDKSPAAQYWHWRLSRPARHLEVTRPSAASSPITGANQLNGYHDQHHNPDRTRFDLRR